MPHRDETPKDALRFAIYRRDNAGMLAAAMRYDADINAPLSERHVGTMAHWAGQTQQLDQFAEAIEMANKVRAGLGLKPIEIDYGRQNEKGLTPTQVQEQSVEASQHAGRGR